MQNDPDIRGVLLQVLDEESVADGLSTNNNLQTNRILDVVARRLNFRGQNLKEQALLTHFHDLFRTGYLAWGFNLSNPAPPFFHLTEQGRRTLEHLSRDPGNPSGYLSHIYSIAQINEVAKSYLEEGLLCYVNALYKSSAVMVGAAAESVLLDVRDTVDAKLTMLGRSAPRGLKDWKLKTILDTLKNVFETQKSNFPSRLRDEYEGYWMAFTQQIRSARNEAGHPSSLDPITPRAVQFSIL